MSTPRAVGVFLCLLGFAAVFVMAFVSTLPRPFAGLSGIQEDLASEALEIATEDVPGAVITAEGRELTVELPASANADFDRAALQSKLEAIDGVRSVELVGDPAISVGGDDAPDPAPTEAPADEEPTAEPSEEPTAEPTEVPTAEPTEEPTAEPTEEPTAEPTEEPEPTPEPTEEPTAEPTEEPEPTPEPTEEPAAPTLSEIVAGIDLGGLQFEVGSPRLTAQDTAVLDSVADALQGQTEGSVQVQAHTSNLGDPDVNLLLSQDRADAVVAYLVDRGVNESLLSAQGFGSSAPIADNSTEQGRAANQRVVLVVEGN